MFWNSVDYINLYKLTYLTLKYQGLHWSVLSNAAQENYDLFPGHVNRVFSINRMWFYIQDLESFQGVRYVFQYKHKVKDQLLLCSLKILCIIFYYNPKFLSCKIISTYCIISHDLVINQLKWDLNKWRVCMLWEENYCNDKNHTRFHCM